jgi:hypothetical protein
VPVPDRLITALRRYSQALPDGRLSARRRGRGKNASYSMTDFALAAFAPFFMQNPSFLAHQRYLETGQGRTNCQTLSGVDKIPCDNQIRAMLDPIEPTHFYPMFAGIMAELQQSGGLDAMRCLDGHMLIALDGTEYHCSRDVHCPNCSHRKRGKDKTEYFHTTLAATVVAPGHNRAVPLEPEFIVPQDGHEKQDCESRAARRWLAAHGAQYRRFDPVYLGKAGQGSSGEAVGIARRGTTCSPASRSARPCWRQGATFCSSASRTHTPRSRRSALVSRSTR